MIDGGRALFGIVLNLAVAIFATITAALWVSAGDVRPWDLLALLLARKMHRLGRISA
jgi:hypothetical protein